MDDTGGHRDSPGDERDGAGEPAPDADAFGGGGDEGPPCGPSGGGVSRRALLSGAGLAGAAAFAGCSALQDDQRGDGSSGGSPAGTAGTDGQPLAGGTLKLGVLAPLPDANPVGEALAEGARLAAAEINGDGGVLGADLEVVVGDTEASPNTGRNEYRRLVRQEGCHATVGVFLTQVLMQVLEPMRQERSVHLTVGAAGPQPARQVAERYEELKYQFRVGPLNAVDLADATLEFLERHAGRLGWETGALLVEDVGALDDYYQHLEGKIGQHLDATTEQISPGIREWGSIYDKVENRGLDVLFVGQSVSGTSAVVQWAREERSFEYGGLHVPAQIPEFYRETNGKAEYVFTMNAVTPESENTDRTRPFMERYRQENDALPAPTGPMAYDAVGIYADAVRRAVQSEGLSEPPDGDVLVPYLEETAYTGGVILPEFRFTGPDAEFAHDPAWSCTAEATCGDDAAGVPVWQQWQARDDRGVQAVFAPGANKTAEYQKPPWI